MLTSLRLYLILGALAAIGGLLWHDHAMTKRANERAAQIKALTATLNTERINTEKANAAAKTFQSRYDALQAERVASPFPAIRVCHKPASVPGVGPATAPADAAAPGGLEGDAAVYTDAGPASDVFGSRCEAIKIQLEELQTWIKNR